MSFEWWHEYLSQHSISESARRVVMLEQERDELRNQLSDIKARSNIERSILDLEWEELKQEKDAVQRQINTIVSKIISKIVRL